MRSAFFAAVLFAAASQPTGAEPPPSVRFEHDMMVRYHMHESYDVFRAIVRLAIHGKLADVAPLARSIGEAPDEPGLSAFATKAADVRVRALALADASDTDEACRRAAKLAAACAHCHVETNTAAEFRDPPGLPVDGTTIEARMARHLWAADRLWEGVVGDSDAHWRAGLDVLAVTPLPWSNLDADRVALAKQLQSVATRARTQPAPIDERARIYGELLVTCAACHAIPNASH